MLASAHTPTLAVVFEERLQGWDGEELVTHYDEPTGTWMFIGVHSTVLGPAMGGTRMNTYASTDDAVGDALRLSQAMSMKQAAAGLPYGGGRPCWPCRPSRPGAPRSGRRSFDDTRTWSSPSTART